MAKSDASTNPAGELSSCGWQGKKEWEKGSGGTAENYE
jgi:hypothetical protein